MSTENKKKKKNSSFRLLMATLFGGKKALSIMEEEQIQSPMKTIVKNFKNNKLAMVGLCTFILIFAIVLIGPYFLKLDLSYSETSQMNIAPARNFLSVPDSLQGKVADMAVGPTYTVAVSTDGRLYIWGYTKITKQIDLKYVGQDVGKVTDIATGFDHVIVLNDQGKVFAWGSDRQKQAGIPTEVAELNNIKDVYAGYQSSLVLTEDGRTYFFGNDNNNDYSKNHKEQGNIDKVAMTSDAVFGMTKDGRAVYLGKQKNSYTTIPDMEGKVIDISATAATMTAITDSGNVYVWGNVSEKGEGNYPKNLSAKPIEVQGGRYHYTMVLEDGSVVAWGSNNFKQTNIPNSLKNKEVVEVYTGFYQNYAVLEDGSIEPWGLKGYVLGTDDLGRDILNRLINGGRMSMTVGAVSVIISTLIGIVIGCISGFFGGKVDILLQRVVEIVSSLPFIPLASILSAVLGNKLAPSQRVYLIMIILGLLSWTGLSRLVRAQVLAEREKEFVTAAKAVGVKQMTIVFKHIFPNVISVVIVNATLGFASSMLTEATLSYLGFGVPAPQPTWGNMLFGSNNSIVIQNYWWRWVFASLILAICVICINLTGDGLRDAVDPKSQER